MTTGSDQPVPPPPGHASSGASRPASGGPGGTSKSWRELHLWQIQPIRDVLLVLGLFGLLWVGQKISLVTVPLLLALLLAYLFEPVVGWLTRKLRVSRQIAAGAILTAFALFVVIPGVLALSFGVVQGIDLVTRQFDNISHVRESLEAERTGGEDFDREASIESLREETGASWVWIREQVAGIDDESMAGALETISDWVSANTERIATTVADLGANAVWVAVALVSSVIGLGFLVFLTVFFFFFVSVSWPSVLRFGDSLIPDKNKQTVHHLVKRFDRVISAFIRGRLTIAFVQAILFTGLYWAIGVPAPFILGPAVAVLAIVPYLALVGVPLSMILLFLEGHTGLRGHVIYILLAPTVVYFLVQAMDDYVLTPLIQGKTTEMSVPLILFASLAGGMLFGFFGLLVAIPIAACLKIVVQELVWPRYKEWVEGRRADVLPLDNES
ncbi:MAG: AI-2E family transporter [Phycisphaerales bacterium]|nr:MAG: AI-2E family transporter [Phycisphaerales bacterium]